MARLPLLCAAAALATLASPDAFWLCVPLALLAAGPARSWRAAAASAALTVLAASLPILNAPTAHPALILAVVGGSIAVQQAMRVRLEGEREAMRRSALTDPLTGAANRRGLSERIEYEVTRHARLKHEFAVVMIDLDGFKGVNDRFGHPAGDELLRDVAAALNEAVRDQDTVARLGGDEFCVLAPETDRGGGDQLARRVEDAIARVTTGLEALSASVGVGVYPLDGRTPLQVLEAADAAQVAAKRNARRSGRRAAAA